MKVSEIENIVNKSLDILYKNEKYLFENGVSERNLVFHFSGYFCILFEEFNTDEKYSIDCEYNRNVFNEKEYKELVCGGKKHKMYPDFILHERGTNINNLLAIEFKKFNNYKKSAINNDKLKLRVLTDPLGIYKYKIGLFIKFGKNRDNVKIEKFIKGQNITQ